MTRPRRTAARSLRQRASQGWRRSELIRTGMAALSITVLGLGAAGAVGATSAASSAGSAETRTPGVVAGGVVAGPGPAFDRRVPPTSRDARRSDAASAVQRRAADLADASAKVSTAQRDAAIDERARELAGASLDTTRAASNLRDQRDRQDLQDRRDREAESKRRANQQPQVGAAAPSQRGTKVVPLPTYRIAARFGAIGPWARYHTGVDFSAALGTPINSAAAGVVTHTGTGGGAGGWAGSYVVVLHEDGYSTLYAHMNPAISVVVGQKVGAGQLIGHVGLTGRTFGPHCHIELYPPGTTPGDVYTAIDILPWLNAR